MLTEDDTVKVPPDIDVAPPPVEKVVTLLVPELLRVVVPEPLFVSEPIVTLPVPFKTEAVVAVPMLYVVTLRVPLDVKVPAR